LLARLARDNSFVKSFLLNNRCVADEVAAIDFKSIAELLC